MKRAFPNYMKIKGWRLFEALFLISFIVLVDMGSKWLALKYISPMSRASSIFPYDGIGIFQNFFGMDFSLNLVFNKGMAWGLFSHQPQLLLVFRLLLILSLFLFIFFKNEKRSHDFPLIMIFSGAVGNVVDFLLHGYVVDIFYFNFWGYSPFAIFNVADFFISIGILFVILQSFLPKLNEYTRFSPY
ncbi:MAG: signal peptidase II [Simkaniaceae bacterium]